MATIFRIVFLLLAATWPAFALSEQHADENFDVTAGARLVVDVDFGTLRTSTGNIVIRSTSPAR